MLLDILSAVDKHLRWRCWGDGLPGKEQSNVHSLFITGFSVVPINYGRRLTYSLCLLFCE